MSSALEKGARKGLVHRGLTLVTLPCGLGRVRSQEGAGSPALPLLPALGTAAPGPGQLAWPGETGTR